MASIRQMSNGRNKPGYISSFMSFLKSQDDDPDDPSALPSAPGGEIEVKKEIEEGDMSFELPEEGEITDKEIKVEVGEEVTSTDYIPTEVHNPDEDNTNSSEATTMSESGDSSKAGRRNVARRGRGKAGGSKPQRESLRRTSRRVKRYGNFDADSDELPESDGDFHLSDSDDDPDFNPLNKKERVSSEEDREAIQAASGVTYPATLAPHTSSSTSVFLQTYVPSPSSPGCLILSPSPSPSQVPTPPCHTSASLATPPGLSPIPDDSPSCSSPTMRPGKRAKQSDPAADIMKLALLKMSSLPNRCEIDPFMDYGRVVGNELKGMTKNQSVMAKRLINEVIYLGNMEMLSGDHHVLQVMGSSSFQI